MSTRSHVLPLCTDCGESMIEMDKVETAALSAGTAITCPTSDEPLVCVRYSKHWFFSTLKRHGFQLVELRYHGTMPEAQRTLRGQSGHPRPFPAEALTPLGPARTAHGTPLSPGHVLSHLYSRAIYFQDTSMQNVPTAREARVSRKIVGMVLAASSGPLLRAVRACVCAGLLIPAAHASDVTRPAMLQAAVPDYPAAARRNGFEGTVHVRVHVLADGKPGEVRVHRSSGARELDAAAVAAAAGSKFRAAQKAEGGSVDAWVIVPYRFVLEDEPKHQATRQPIEHSAPEAP